MNLGVIMIDEVAKELNETKSFFYRYREYILGGLILLGGAVALGIWLAFKDNECFLF